MECYEGATMIKTFRGQIVDGGQDTIVLHTNNGSTGYRIVNLRAIPNSVGTVTVEGIFQIWKVEQTTVPTSSATVDFSDNTLLGVAVCRGSTDVGAYGTDDHVIFDKEIFNQDIFITYTDNQGTDPGNYYIELEQIKLDLSENTVATLKDIRNETAVPLG